MNTFIDLFCGIGGFRLALEKMGLSCEFSCDIDQKVREVYFDNFGSFPASDITKIKASDIPSHDILCAGFPCQPFSISGLKKGIDDGRGRLFGEIIRIAKYHKPSLLLLENVPNLLRMNNGKIIAGMKKALVNIGYNVKIGILNLKDYGVPQNRPRLYFVCLNIQSNLVFNRKKEHHRDVCLNDILDNNVDDKYYISDDMASRYRKGEHTPRRTVNGLLQDGGIITSAQLRKEKTLKRPLKFYQGYRVYLPKGVAVTQIANAGGAGAKCGIYKIGGRLRKLSITEVKRVMGFPDNHIVSSGEEARKQLGNAVCPIIIENIYNMIKSGVS